MNAKKHGDMQAVVSARLKKAHEMSGYTWPNTKERLVERLEWCDEMRAFYLEWYNILTEK
jgi:hypothetical protein